MRKNIALAALAATVTLSTITGTGITANAAELPATQAQPQVVKQQLDAKVIAKVFDAKYYAEKNPDVVAVVGTDDAALMNHYMKNGIYEGRDASATFNATIYALANTDLATIYGENIEGLVEHYLAFGINEGRIASGEALINADVTTQRAFAATMNSSASAGSDVSSSTGNVSFASSITSSPAIAHMSSELDNMLANYAATHDGAQPQVTYGPNGSVDVDYGHGHHSSYFYGQWMGNTYNDMEAGGPSVEQQLIDASASDPGMVVYQSDGNSVQVISNGEVHESSQAERDAYLEELGVSDWIEY